MKRWRIWILVLTLLWVILRGYFAYGAAERALDAQAKKVGERAIVRGVIESEVVEKAGTLFFQVAGVEVSTAAFTHVSYGDRIEAEGTFTLKDYGDPRRRVSIKKARVRVIATGEGNIIMAAALWIKEVITVRLQQLYHEPHASLAGGILIGTRSDIPRSLLDDFKAAGLMHVVAVSGFNMVIIITAVTQLLSILYRRTASVIALIFIVFFTMLVGASGAVIRAAIMSSLRLIAWLIGRPQYVKRLFVLTALSMIVLDPLGVVYDIGFQLSVAATGGLIWLSEPINKRIGWIPERFGLRENMASTIAATLATLPITWGYFQNFSYLSIPINLIVVPFIPWLMLGSFVSLFFGVFIAVPTGVIFDLVVFIIERGAFLERLLH